MNMLSEVSKLDIALVPASLNGAGTGEFFRVNTDRKALFVVILGAMAVSATSAIQVMQASDAAGTGAKVITNNAATVTANTKVAAATLNAAASQAGDTCVINGLTFTAIANGATPAGRQFAVGTGASADTDTATALAAIINNETYGVPGVKASASAAVVTLTAIEPGDATITVVGTAVRLVAATLRAVAYVECDASFLDINNGFNHVAIRVTNSAAILTGATLQRGSSRYAPIQTVAASKTDVA